MARSAVTAGGVAAALPVSEAEIRAGSDRGGSPVSARRVGLGRLLADAVSFR